MPPIPVHIDDPITPQKPQGVTQQTSDQQQASSANNPPSTTQNVAREYPAARPGAAVGPSPTPYIPQPQPQPSRTTQPLTGQNGPPPPQPGAVPVPLSQQAPSTNTSTLPPPPKAGESLQQWQTTMPAQMNVAPPQQNYAPTHSTITNAYTPTSTTQQSGGPSTLDLGPVAAPPAPSNHPPGYHQNLQAQEMTAAQRSSLEQQERRESGIPNLGFGGAGAGAGNPAGDTGGNMWNAVKGWANAAGEKLAETEENVWKRINGQ